MNLKVVGVGELAASNTPGQIIKTYALGSCVAVILLHPGTRSVGMVHVALPDSSISPERARKKPGFFADTGISELFKTMGRLGCDPRGRDYIVKLAGGAKVMDPNSTFNIGNRNVLAIKKLLWERGLGPLAEDVGGSISRTVAAHINTGKVVLSSAARDEWEI